MKYHITYEPDEEAGDFVILENRLDKPLEPRARCRARNEGIARQKAGMLAGRMGCSFGPAKSKAEAAVDREVAALLALLDQSIPKLAAALETGEHDDYLQGIYDAEVANENRRGARREIKKRQRNTIPD